MGKESKRDKISSDDIVMLLFLFAGSEWKQCVRCA